MCDMLLRFDPPLTNKEQQRDVGRSKRGVEWSFLSVSCRSLHCLSLAVVFHEIIDVLLPMLEQMMHSVDQD